MSVTWQPSPLASAIGKGGYQITARVLPPGSAPIASLCLARLFGLAAAKRSSASARTASRSEFRSKAGEALIQSDSLRVELQKRDGMTGPALPISFCNSNTFRQSNLT